MYLGLCIHVGPLVDEDFSHIHSVFLSSQMEWGEAALQEIPGMSVTERGECMHVSGFEIWHVNSNRVSFDP